MIGWQTLLGKKLKLACLLSSVDYSHEVKTKSGKTAKLKFNPMLKLTEKMCFRDLGKLCKLSL